MIAVAATWKVLDWLPQKVLMMTGQRAASEAAIVRAGSNAGKFQTAKATTGPTGSERT
ncbi:hypothetical protein [Shinella sp.]|uniref:hypothetical protein n=1 Tax=Shinella sp. TaxID=1870904 RepID=UPI00301C8153